MQPEVDFSQIESRGGGKDTAFEELCSQLARKTLPSAAKFERFRGAGGDGGVECLMTLDDDSQIGWQAKYVFDVEALIKQVSKSLETALTVHENLTKYVVCCPFDFTGETKRKGKSESTKFKEWADAAVAQAKVNGRNLTIEAWPEHRILELLNKYDVSGGIRIYFFTSVILSNDWFKRHLDGAVKIAGPRYTPKLDVQTDLSAWFAAFEVGEEWQTHLKLLIAACRHSIKELLARLETSRPIDTIPAWPTGLLSLGKDIASACEALIAKIQLLLESPTADGLFAFLEKIRITVADLEKLENHLIDDLEAKYGKGVADSQRFRQKMAEYECCFPAGNLDSVRDMGRELTNLDYWLSSPAGYLAFVSVFVLSGAGGSGKTHGICQIALDRFAKGAYTCVVFGHQFGGQPDIWTRLTESLGLPLTLGKDSLLDALNAAGIASGTPLILCIDAVNETRPRDYWLQRYAALVHEIEQRSYLKLCITCRSSFLPVCLPMDGACRVVTHRGFLGMERQACDAFFGFYGLKPPLIPILQPELSNPLYLKLVCETLKLKGLSQLPLGWSGLSSVIRNFLSEKENKFSIEHQISSGAAIVSGSLFAIAEAIASSGEPALKWSEAQAIINIKKPQATHYPVLEWLVYEDLLIEDGPSQTDSVGSEYTLRPAFERFGDFLIADELLSKIKPEDLEKEAATDGKIERLCRDKKTIGLNTGVLLALSVLIPEVRHGTELPDLVASRSLHQALINITIQALPWRTPETFTPATQKLVIEAIAGNEAWEAIDALLSVTTLPSPIDSHWIASLLKSRPLAKRDAFWCAYLKERFEQNGIVKRLIEASDNLTLEQLDDQIAGRWALVLLWFAAAADRRVKDCATRSAIAILRAKTTIILPLIEHFLSTDDDDLKERVLLCAYGALLISPEEQVLKATAESLLTAYKTAPKDFQNALIRDHIRCVAELASYHSVLSDKFDPKLPSLKNASEWPLELPSNEQIESWANPNSKLRLLLNSCLNDDFFNYSISCLNDWFHGMKKDASAHWILRHVVVTLGYERSGCEEYDERVTRESGGGRNKPTWAERIGKKYQWIALFRLASRMHDNLEREVSSWEPKSSEVPLILQDERKLDPSLTKTKLPDRTPSACWWIKSTVNLTSTRNLPFPNWLALKNDLPDLETLLTPIAQDGQTWRLLYSNATWDDKPEEADYDTPYRYTWFHLRSFLVPKAMVTRAQRSLEGRNFFGDWLPKGAKWLHCFAGEYPWATVYDTALDHYHGWDGSVRNSDLTLLPTSNEVIAEWEYDGSLPKSIYLSVPAREFFEESGLTWNGKDGFKARDGKSIFRDPHAAEGGASGLVADDENLIQCLDRLGYGLLWTLLGEKTILNDKTPGVVYSQIACLKGDGAIDLGKRVFFTDLEKDQGLAKK